METTKLCTCDVFPWFSFLAPGRAHTLVVSQWAGEGRMEEACHHGVAHPASHQHHLVLSPLKGAQVRLHGQFLSLSSSRLHSF